MDRGWKFVFLGRLLRKRLDQVAVVGVFFDITPLIFMEGNQILHLECQYGVHLWLLLEM